MKSILFVFIALVGFSVKPYAQKVDIELPAKQVLLDSSWLLDRALHLRKRAYLDAGGKKVVLQVLTARLNRRKLRLEAATPDNKDIFARRTVQAEMEAEDTQGHRVLAGVNADFFNMKNGTPLGPVIKEGRMLKTGFNGTNAFVGGRKNGRIIIGDSSIFNTTKNKLREALGARPLLIKDKHLITQDTGSLSTVHHPRTALGIKRSGKEVIMVVVDGRQPEYSNGISLTDLSKVMRYLGADNAVNLDGGGSSTLVVADKDKRGYQILNLPSDKTPRTVANSWILVKTQ